MTDPVRTALEEAVRGHVAYTSGGATYCDNCHRAWPCAPVFDLMHANSHERAATLALAALATPPASPEPEAERIDRWGDKGPCGFVHPGGTPCLIERYKHPNVVAIGHRWKPTKPDQPAPAPPTSAEALRDALLDDLAKRWPERGRKRMRDTVANALPAIIAAARATPPLTVEAPREHPGEHHTFSMACDRCGKRGYVNLSVIGPDERLSIEPLAEQGR